MKIFLTGVGCVGKTTIGARLASLMNYPFFDLDTEVERYFGRTYKRAHLTVNISDLGVEGSAVKLREALRSFHRSENELYHLGP